MGDIDLKVISARENSNKFQRTRFLKDKSIKDMITLGPKSQVTLVYFYHIILIGKFIAFK